MACISKVSLFVFVLAGALQACPAGIGIRHLQDEVLNRWEIPVCLRQPGTTHESIDRERSESWDYTLPVALNAPDIPIPLGWAVPGSEWQSGGDSTNMSLAVPDTLTSAVDPYFKTRWLVPLYASSDSVKGTYPIPFEGYNPDETNINVTHAIITGGAMAGLITAIHFYQQNAWWADNRCNFHVVEDPDYALNIDKCGHLFGGAFSSFLGQKAMQWSGFSEEVSVLGGFAIGSLFELYVEFEDGYACDWGFSPGDAYADLLGAAFPVGQHYIPGMKYFQPKYSYFPSKAIRDGTHHGNAIDDYEGQTYWMGVHIDGLLPKAVADYWPDWLALAVGVSIRDMDTPSMHRNVIIALDYDWTNIIPGDSWWLQSLKEAMNYIHFPAPAIRISPGFIAYGLYFY